MWSSHSQVLGWHAKISEDNLMSLARFAEKWGSGTYPPEPVSEADLQTAEHRFAVRLPDGYRRALLQTGLPRPTIALLDAIVDGELDLHSLGSFYTPSEIVDETLTWRELGMPEHLIAIASDGCGNTFCFDGNRLRNSSGEGQAIWFFDHDFRTARDIAPSFEAWIAAYCEVEPSPRS